MSCPPRDVFEYTSSHRIECVGPLLRKDLSTAALSEPARANRVQGFHDPYREPEIYRRLLTPLRIGPRCIDSGVDWVLLEHVHEPALWQIGDPSTWIGVAAWTAGMHRTLAGDGRLDAAGLPLVVHDAELMAAWRRRAAEAGAAAPIIAAHRRAARHLSAQPNQIVHGELYASNVLARARPRDADGWTVDVWPIDWEVAGWAPAVLDVAAITMGGGLDPGVRAAMERAYYDVAQPTDPWDTWCNALDAARLHLCVQWLGWSTTWTPPEEHRHDWHSEALRVAERLT